MPVCRHCKEVFKKKKGEDNPKLCEKCWTKSLKTKWKGEKFVK